MDPIVEKRKLCEENILAVIKKYEDETGRSITSIHLRHDERLGKNPRVSSAQIVDTSY